MQLLKSDCFYIFHFSHFRAKCHVVVIFYTAKQFCNQNSNKDYVTQCDLEQVLMKWGSLKYNVCRNGFPR